MHHILAGVGWLVPTTDYALFKPEVWMKGINRVNPFLFIKNKRLIISQRGPLKKTL